MMFVTTVSSATNFAVLVGFVIPHTLSYCGGFQELANTFWDFFSSNCSSIAVSHMAGVIPPAASPFGSK